MGNARNFEVQKNRINANVSGIELAISSTTGSVRNLVANNFIQSSLSGIRLTSTTTNNDILYNSINIQDPIDTSGQMISSAFTTFAFSGSNNKIINNLFINRRSGYAFTFSGSGLSSLNFNNYYTNGNNLASWQGTNYADLNSFRSVSGRDTNSVSKRSIFTSPTDLHLFGSSNGDEMLLANPVSIVTEDIDLEPRHIVYPYMGADEASTILPVELVSFNYSVVNRNVILYWTTSTEENNSGFELERSIINDQWKRIGFVRGNGTSTTPKNYSFEDKDLNSGKYEYRLKQIDYNGNFKYYYLNTEVQIGIPVKFDLSQNYPNPFNPKTIINYQLPLLSFVVLKVYEISGREIFTLVNEKQPAGYYSVEFNSNNLSSGVYIYRIIADGFIQSKRMILLK